MYYINELVLQMSNRLMQVIGVGGMILERLSARWKKENAKMMTFVKFINENSDKFI